MYTIERAIKDYQVELDSAIEMKNNNVTHVSADVAGERIAVDFDTVPIDTYITYWKTKLDELITGKDSRGNAINVEDYNY
jgi:hypothetical protein